jgi:hypothetical protein
LTQHLLWLLLLVSCDAAWRCQGKMRRDIDALTREISAAAAAAATAREKAGGSLSGQQHGVTSVIVGQKRPRTMPGMPGHPAAAAAAAAEGSAEPSAEDVLLAKIMSGELMREDEMRKRVENSKLKQQQRQSLQQQSQAPGA